MIRGVYIFDRLSMKEFEEFFSKYASLETLLRSYCIGSWLLPRFSAGSFFKKNYDEKPEEANCKSCYVIWTIQETSLIFQNEKI